MCYIGYNDKEVEGRWEWSDGSRIDFTSWVEPWEPNDGGNQDVAAIIDNRDIEHDTRQDDANALHPGSWDDVDHRGRIANERPSGLAFVCQGAPQSEQSSRGGMTSVVTVGSSDAETGQDRSKINTPFATRCSNLVVVRFVARALAS